MTRKEAQSFINSLVQLRTSATPEQAIAAPSVYPAWREGVEYRAEDVVLYEEILYTVLIAHTSQADWTPNVAHSLFAKLLIPDEDIIPAWEQPDSTNAYKIGDKVSCNDKIWISIVDNNVWAPGTYGWDEVK